MKKIFSSLLVVLILAVSNVVAAQNINWNSAPRFNNLKSLVHYLTRCKYNLNTTVPVVLTNGFVPNFNDILLVGVFHWLKSTNYGSDGQNTKMLYEITNYPGERVAYAYRHNNTSFLNSEEIRLYNEAVKIVNEAKRNSPTQLRLELYLHNAITSRTKYYTESNMKQNSRFTTAFGVLLDGRANCQGYSDAFYMLGTMCGFNVDKVSGYGNNEAHVWNTITFGDRSYFVDVTFDDDSFNVAGTNYVGFIYFNIPTDIAGADHRWFVDYVPSNLQKYPDGRYFFYTQEYETTNGGWFGAHTNSAEDALRHIAYNIAKRGWKYSYVCAPYNATYAQINYSLNHLLKDLLPQYGWRGHVNMYIKWLGNYMFYMVDATKA
ncbi:MAG: hypothetical protein IKZ58_05065 [Selenomonadaceae bacterium]|nr:hypothetical protein [Selenomonadaceae bacterium]